MKNIKQIPKPKHISQSVCMQVRGRVPVSVCVCGIANYNITLDWKYLF